MNVTITPNAEKFMRRMVRFNGGSEGSGLRLLVSAGGCSGLSSEFTVEAAPLPGDSVVESNGLKVFLPAESRLLLDGVTIDFSDSAMNSGLSFFDPKATSCACSSSAAPGVATIDMSKLGRKH